MGHVYKATHKFGRSYYALPQSQQRAAQRSWRIFREDPFAPSLKSHRIASLSRRYQFTVYSARVAADLRVLFCVHGDTVITLDIGTHDIYRQ